MNMEYVLIDSVYGDTISVQTETYLNHFFSQLCSGDTYHVTVLERWLDDDRNVVAQHTLVKVAQNIPLDVREW